jgi:hypothetical protein
MIAGGNPYFPIFVFYATVQGTKVEKGAFL